MAYLPGTTAVMDVPVIDRRFTLAFLIMRETGRYTALKRDIRDGSPLLRDVVTHGGATCVTFLLVPARRASEALITR